MKAVTLHGEDLTLHPLRAEDEALYVRLYTDAELMAHIGPALTGAQAASAFDRSRRFNANPGSARLTWVIVEQGCPVGFIGITRHDFGPYAYQHEIGAILLLETHNRSIAERAIRCLVESVQTRIDVRRLITRHRPRHHAAAGLMKKLGFISSSGAITSDDHVLWSFDCDPTQSTLTAQRVDPIN